MRRQVALVVAVVLSAVAMVGAAYATRAEPAGDGLEPQLVVSASPDRTGAARLHGRRIGGDAYVFATGVAPGSRVTFTVDGVPVRTVDRAPYDLGGTAADGTARPYPIGAMAEGAHTVVAEVSTGATARRVVAGVVAAPAWRPFRAQSAWNSPIREDAAVDPRSATLARALARGSHVADLVEFGVPIYDADAATPRHRVICVSPWGPCPVAQGAIPIPAGAAPSPGSDRAMVVLDRAAGLSYEFWEFEWRGGVPAATWGDIRPLDGDGSYGPTGAGVSRLAGVVRESELAQGFIPHALAFSSKRSCVRVFRPPATKTDGRLDAPDCLPQGSRIQLDPSIDVSSLPGLTPAERTVARALQVFGAYNIDVGGAEVALIFETPRDGLGTYPQFGLGSDYSSLDHLPWDRIRVLAPPPG